MCILSDFLRVLLKPGSWVLYFAVQRAWGFGVPGFWQGQGCFQSIQPQRAWQGDLRTGRKLPLGSHLHSGQAAALIAFQSPFPPPRFLGCNYVSELSGSSQPLLRDQRAAKRDTAGGGLFRIGIRGSLGVFWCLHSGMWGLYQKLSTLTLIKREPREHWKWW